MFINEQVALKNGHELTQLRTSFQSKMKCVTFDSLTKNNLICQ